MFVQHTGSIQVTVQTLYSRDADLTAGGDSLPACLLRSLGTGQGAGKRELCAFSRYPLPWRASQALQGTDGALCRWRCAYIGGESSLAWAYALATRTSQVLTPEPVEACTCSGLHSDKRPPGVCIPRDCGRRRPGRYLRGKLLVQSPLSTGTACLSGGLCWTFAGGPSPAHTAMYLLRK